MHISNVDSPKQEVRITSYSRNGCRFIDFLIPPDTPAATYRQELRTRTPSGAPRRGVYRAAIRVGAVCPDRLRHTE